MNQHEQEKEKKIFREMAPYFIHIIWPVLIILLIAKAFAPSTY